MITVINPSNGLKLERVSDKLVDSLGNSFPIADGIPRIAGNSGYTENFGMQWKKFAKTQLDRGNLKLSKKRFFSQNNWDTESLEGMQILEVGSGAGRFSRVVLEHTKAELWSVDYSDAVTVNFENNGRLAPERFHLLQASIYELPFEDNSFDKVFCFGVLQHTPSFEESVRALIAKAKPGGEIVVDFYPIRGWWTKVHAKYLLRPLTTRLSHRRLLAIIEKNIDWLIRAHDFLQRVGLGHATRFLPVADLTATLPGEISAAERREWAILDTFDMFSPAYDNPKPVAEVADMFARHGARVSFSGFVQFDGASAAVVRGIKRS